MRIEVDKLPEYLQKLFVADGLKGIPSPYRAPWFDQEERKRRGNKRDFVCNVCASPRGAAETPFDHAVLEEIKIKDIRKPDYEGDLIFRRFSNGRIDNENITFEIRLASKKLKWWGRLPFGRPDQRHNYIIGADISYGLGSANSTVIVYDRNAEELVGAWADANTKPEILADWVVALAYWCGGINPTYIIWDTGGGCGSMFTDRLIYNRYPYLYTQRREDSKTRKMTQKWGWFGHGKAKDALLGELGVALSGGLIEEDNYKSIIIHDKDLLDELFDYVFKENGQGAVTSSKADLSTGALERHGDRVIAVALCILACKEQGKGNWQKSINPPNNSFQERYNKFNEELSKDKRELRHYLF